MESRKSVTLYLIAIAALLFLAPLAFAQPVAPVKSVTLENCLISNLKVDGKLIGEVKVSLKIDVPSKSGSGNFQLTKPDGRISDFEMQCKQMTGQSYLVGEKFAEFIICDTVNPVINGLTYGIPIWVDEQDEPHVETYTVFSDGQGFSGLVYSNCERAQSIR